MELTQCRDRPFPPTQKNPRRNQITTEFEYKLLNTILPSLQIKVRTPLVKRWLFLRGIQSERLGLSFTLLKPIHPSPVLENDLLHAGFGLEAVTFERSVTGNFLVLYEAATTAWLWLAAGGGQIVLRSMKNTLSSAAIHPVLPIIINERKYQRNIQPCVPCLDSRLHLNV